MGSKRGFRGVFEGFSDRFPAVDPSRNVVFCESMHAFAGPCGTSAGPWAHRSRKVMVFHCKGLRQICGTCGTFSQIFSACAHTHARAHARARTRTEAGGKVPQVPQVPQAICNPRNTKMLRLRDLCGTSFSLVPRSRKNLHGMRFFIGF